MKVTEFVLILLVGVLSGMLVGGCNGNEGSCTVDALRCATVQESSVVEICAVIGVDLTSGDRDFTWNTHDICEADEICVETTGVPESARCACERTATRCSEDATQVEVCNDQEEWEELRTCEEGTMCEVAGEVADCFGPCEDGATRCSADSSQVQTCTDNAWSATTTCDENENEVCRVVGDTAQCVAADDDCTTDLDALRCNPDDDVWIQECRNVGTMETPKMEWRDYIDCSEGSADEICIEDPDVGTSPMCGLP